MSNNRIQLDGDGYRTEEAIAAEAMYPGNIVEKNSSGYVRKHNEEGGYGLVAVVVEDALQGDTDSDQYASAALVMYHIQTPGTRFRALLKAGENVAIGAQLISDGAGRLIAKTSRGSDDAVKQVMAYAEEAEDLSSSGSSDTLISVRSA